MSNELDESCLFCRIVAGHSQAKVVFQDEQAVAFRDINPQAPVHLLVIPRAHLPSLSEAVPEQSALLGHLLITAARLARDAGLEEQGYRTVINTGAEAGQTVFHLHVHVIGGRPMRWPPG